MVVFDAFPVQLLMDADSRIDARRFPNFARFARRATWYSNATTVHENTVYAVPAMLDGRVPGRGAGRPCMTTPRTSSRSSATRTTCGSPRRRPISARRASATGLTTADARTALTTGRRHQRRLCPSRSAERAARAVAVDQRPLARLPRLAECRVCAAAAEERSDRSTGRRRATPALAHLDRRHPARTATDAGLYARAAAA